MTLHFCSHFFYVLPARRFMTPVSESFSWKFFFSMFLDCLLVTNKHWSGGRRKVDSSDTLFATRLRGERGDTADDKQGSSDDTGDTRGDIKAGLSQSRFLVNRW